MIIIELQACSTIEMNIKALKYACLRRSTVAINSENDWGSCNKIRKIPRNSSSNTASIITESMIGWLVDSG